MTYPEKDPSYNPYSVLAEKTQTSAKKKVKAKVTQNQQNPVVQPQPQPDPLVAHRQQLRTAARNKLTDTGFVRGQNTYVYQLDARAQHANMVVGTHLTINIADLEAQINQATINRTARYVLQQTRYHVTVEEFDNVNDVRNPRWYSDGNQWSTNQQSAFQNTDVANLPTVQDAIDEANGIIGVVRQ